MKVRNKTRQVQHKQGYHIVFVTGKSHSRCNQQIHQENLQFHDVLQFDHTDSYHNLTLSVLYSLHFLHNLSLPVQYVLKTDSDCVVNYPLLHTLLDQIPPSSASRNRVYMGACRRNTKYNVYDASKKNFIPISLTQNELWYSYYVTGGGYVLSYSLLPELLVGASHLKFIGHFEDVNVGRALELVGVKCIDRSSVWIHRHGCPDKQTCLKAVVIHPKHDKDEIDRFYSYLALTVCCPHTNIRFSNAFLPGCSFHFVTSGFWSPFFSMCYLNSKTPIPIIIFDHFSTPVYSFIFVYQVNSAMFSNAIRTSIKALRVPAVVPLRSMMTCTNYRPNMILHRSHPGQLYVQRRTFWGPVVRLATQLVASLTSTTIRAFFQAFQEASGLF